MKSEVLKFVEHVLSMEDDAYLSGHPEFMAMVEEAKALHEKLNADTFHTH